MFSNTNEKNMFNKKTLIEMSYSLNKKFILNAVGFQIVWFICVQGNNLNAALATIALLILHQFVFRMNLKAWPLLIAFSLIGYLGDSAIASLLQIQYTDGLTHLAPLWLLSLWLAFSTTLNYSMQWLFKTPILTIFIALGFVPLSYLVGIEISGSSLQSTYGLFYIIEGLWWAILLIGYQKMSLFRGVEHA